MPESVLEKGLDKVKEILKPEAAPEKSKNPQHLAITMEGAVAYAKKEGITLAESYKKCFTVITNLLQIQTKWNIPILTISVLHERMKKDAEPFTALLEQLALFLEQLKDNKAVHDHKIKVSVLGKWYNLPGKVVEPIKDIIEATKDYDSFFLNLCINYNGQEEIVDACKLIARQIKADKLDADLITKEVVKENLYSSYFVPPDLVIKTGLRHEIPGLLLWDSMYAIIYFAEKYFPELTRKDIDRAVGLLGK